MYSLQYFQGLNVRMIWILFLHRIGCLYGPAIAGLLTVWPEESLKMSKLFPEKKIDSLLQATDDNNCTVLDMILDGLLNLKSNCRLVHLDLSCVPPSSRELLNLYFIYLKLSFQRDNFIHLDEHVRCLMNTDFTFQIYFIFLCSFFRRQIHCGMR